MSKYTLRTNYKIAGVEATTCENCTVIDVPMLNSDKLLHGLNHIAEKLRSCHVYPSEVGFDILTLASLVYLADTRIERKLHGQDSWSREISLVVSVKNVDMWNRQIPLLNRMLRFLTGDIWDVSFDQREWLFEKETEDIVERTSLYNQATLFSGGMDSLISTINLMEQGQNTLLFAHAGDGYTKHAQTDIVDAFDEKYPDIMHTLIDLWMSFPENYIPGGGNDTNTRSRSFLFIGFAVFSITGTQNIKELLVPENGLIALNVPLEITRVGSFSTRTTHPFYLECWNELLRGLLLDISVRNPYWNKTKGEMAAECLNTSFLKDAMKLSVSCSSPGKARWRGIGAQHCGYCVPCIIRRAAMFKAFGEDVTEYTELSIKNMQRNNDSGIGVQLRSFQYAIEKIKDHPGIEKLYIHKSGPLPNREGYLEELADTYKRGLLEVDSLIEVLLSEEGEPNDL